MRNMVALATLLVQNPLSYQRIRLTNESTIIMINQTKAWYYTTYSICPKKVNANDFALMYADHRPQLYPRRRAENRDPLRFRQNESTGRKEGYRSASFQSWLQKKGGITLFLMISLTNNLWQFYPGPVNHRPQRQPSPFFTLPKTAEVKCVPAVSTINIPQMLTPPKQHRMAGDCWKMTWSDVPVVPSDGRKKGCQMKLNSAPIY
ncbi:hypothetical protein Tco_0581024, partial [Tanacetum coccineum]